MDEIKELDVVALKEDLPEHGLRQGEVGTVVDRWKDGAYEIEFSDNSGETYAFAALPSSQLLKLHFEKIEPVVSPPLKPEARILLDEGFAYLNNGDEVQAENQLRSAIALDPRSRGAILNSILRSFDSNEDWESRIQGLRFLYHLAPEYEYGRNNLAITYLNYGVEKAREGDSEQAMLLFSYAITLDVTPDVASKVRENYAGILTTLGIRDHQKGDYANTVAAMRVARMVFPSEATRLNLGLAYAYLALFHMDRGQYGAAIPVFEEAEEAGLILPELLNDYAIALVFEKREEEAILAFRRALGLFPNNYLIQENLNKLSRHDSKESLVHEELKVQYMPIPTASYQYQLAA